MFSRRLDCLTSDGKQIGGDVSWSPPRQSAVNYSDTSSGHRQSAGGDGRRAGVVPLPQSWSGSSDGAGAGPPVRACRPPPRRGRGRFNFRTSLDLFVQVGETGDINKIVPPWPLYGPTFPAPSTLERRSSPPDCQSETNGKSVPLSDRSFFRFLLLLSPLSLFSAL